MPSAPTPGTCLPAPTHDARFPDVDVMVSNAAFQWVQTHRELIQKWARVASPGTWLAWQVPGNFGAPSHVVLVLCQSTDARDLDKLGKLRNETLLLLLNVFDQSVHQCCPCLKSDDK